MDTATVRNDIRVTVIVPFHNAELTIGTTARSLFEQTLQDLEIIFVNDGSLDRGFDIINDMLVRYPDRIDTTSILFYTFNRGTAAAYDTGLAHASGKYVITARPGDYLEAHALRIMADKAAETDADIVWCEHYTGHTGRNKRVRISRGAPDINRMRIDYGAYSMHNKLIRRDMLLNNGIAATKGVNSWKDICVVSKTLSLQPDVAFIKTPLYHHDVPDQTPGDYECRDYLTTTLILEQWFIEAYPDNRFQPFLNNLKFTAKSYYLCGKNKEIGLWKATFPEINGRICSISALSWRKRWLYSAICWSPEWLAKIIARLFIK